MAQGDIRTVERETAAAAADAAPVNYTPHIQFLASAAAGRTPEEFREVIQDLMVTTPDEEGGLSKVSFSNPLGLGDDTLLALSINADAAKAISAAGGDGVAAGPIGELLQSNDPKLWESVHHTFSNQAVVTALQNPELQGALTKALGASDTSALSALGIDPNTEAGKAAIQQIKAAATTDVLSTLGSAQSINLGPEVEAPATREVIVTKADGSRIELDQLVEEQGFHAALEQQLGADHPVVARLAQDPAMGRALLDKLTASGENSPLSSLNLGAAGEAAVAAAVGPKIIEALRNAQTITVDGDNINILPAGGGEAVSLDSVMITAAVPAILDQTPTAASPAYLHAFHNDPEFKASFERLIEVEPEALDVMAKFMGNGVGLENSTVMQDLLRNDTSRAKMIEVMDEVATRDDVSFEQVAGVLQTASEGGIMNYMDAFQQFNKLGLETSLLTGDFVMAAGGTAALSGLSNVLGGILEPLLQLIDFIAGAMGFDLNLTQGFRDLRDDFIRPDRFETEVRDVDAAATTSTRPTAEFRTAAEKAVSAATPEAGAEAEAAPLSTFDGVRNVIFQAEAELGDELEGLAGTPSLRDQFMERLNGLGSISEKLDAIAEWRNDLASGQTVRQATLGMGGA